jgi:hypothetical protein
MSSIGDLLERDCVALIDSTIPAHLTIAEWRRARGRHRVESRRRRLRRRVLEACR